MALSNSQYNAIMREYEQQQVRNRHDQEARIARVYERIPQMRELDADTGARAAACARRVLGGDAKARQTLKEELEDIREQKRILLAAAGFPEDYMEPRYRCPDCQDTGYADGKRCHCFQQARISVLYAQSNIREVLERENFETLSYTYYDDSQVVPGMGMSELAYMKLVIRQCRDFAEHFPDKGKNILFTGSTGVGKTFLTNCIARCLIERYRSVIYLSSQDLFEVLSRYRFGREAEEGVGDTYYYILDCDMLIIDDLGTELNNAFVSSQLFYCINERINRGRGTVISTNLSMGMLRDTYSDRVTSRIMSHYTTIPLYGPDIRLMKKDYGPAQEEQGNR